MLRKKIQAILVILTFMLLCGCEKTTNQSEKEEKIEAETRTDETIVELEEEENAEGKSNLQITIDFSGNSNSKTKVIDTKTVEINSSYKNDFYFEQLTSLQQKIFTTILDNIDLIQKEYIIGFTDVSRNDIERAVEAILMDNLYYYLDFSVDYQINDVMFVKFQLQTEITEKQKKQTLEEADQILQTIEGTSQEEIIIQIYDWCTTNITYDETQHGRDLYGAIVKGKSVCVGYARAFAYLCNQKGINCICVGNNMHMWNYLSFDNQWYSVDATFGQSATSKYLLQGKSSLRIKEHVPDLKYFKLPKLAEKDIYPTQEQIEEDLNYIEKNLKTADLQIQAIENYKKDYEDGEKYEDIYILYKQYVELATEILNNADNTKYYRYLNTEEYSEKYKELQDIAIQINKYDW